MWAKRKKRPAATYGRSHVPEVCLEVAVLLGLGVQVEYQSCRPYISSDRLHDKAPDHEADPGRGDSATKLARKRGIKREVKNLVRGKILPAPRQADGRAGRR